MAGGFTTGTGAVASLDEVGRVLLLQDRQERTLCVFGVLRAQVLVLLDEAALVYPGTQRLFDIAPCPRGIAHSPTKGPTLRHILQPGALLMHRCEPLLIKTHELRNEIDPVASRGKNVPF